MGYMSEIMEYKKEIKKAILTSQPIKDLIANQTNTTWTIKQFDEFVIPFNRHPDTITEAGTYILFDVDPTKQKTSTTMDYALRVWIITHNSLNLIEGKGVRVDILTNEIDKLLTESQKFGIGKLQSGGAPSVNTSSGFAGRVLIYYAVDFRGRSAS
jgi:hypothetical protein